MIIYRFKCICGAEYVGRSTRSLVHRAKEHIPKWLLEGKVRPRSQLPPNSAVTKHLLDCEQANLNRDNFNIIKRCANIAELFITEAVAIKFINPSLCVQKDLMHNCRLL